MCRCSEILKVGKQQQRQQQQQIFTQLIYMGRNLKRCQKPHVLLTFSGYICLLCVCVCVCVCIYIYIYKHMNLQLKYTNSRNAYSCAHAYTHTHTHTYTHTHVYTQVHAHCKASSSTDSLYPCCDIQHQYVNSVILYRTCKWLNPILQIVYFSRVLDIVSGTAGSTLYCHAPRSGF